MYKINVFDNLARSRSEITIWVYMDDYRGWGFGRDPDMAKHESVHLGNNLGINNIYLIHLIKCSN